MATTSRNCSWEVGRRGPWRDREPRSAATAPIFVGSDVSGSDIVIPTASASAYWRFWDGQMSFAKAGCYTLAFQGDGVDNAVTLYVHSGSPPPG